MSDGRLFITLTDYPISSGRNGNAGSRGKGQEPRGEGLIRHQVNQFVINQATQAIDYCVNNMGNFTGDYHAQRQTQRLMNFGKTAFNIGAAFYVNPALGGFALAGRIITFAEQEHANEFAIKKQNYTINRLRDISGLDNLTNGSR